VDQPVKRRALLAGASAGLFFVGYAGVGLWPAACVFAVPLLFALGRDGVTPRSAVGIGLFAGTLAQLFGYTWLVPTLARFSGLPAWACVPIFVLFALYQGGAWAIACGLAVRAARCGWSVPWAFVGAWTAVEWLYPSLFETPLAASVHAVPALLQIVDLGGPGLLSGLLAACSAALYVVLQRGRAAWRAPLLVTCAFAAALGYGALRTASVQAQLGAAPTLKVALVQANLGLTEKRRDRQTALRRHLEPSLRVEREHAPDLIVWPETAVPAVISLTERDLAPLVGSLRTPVLLGALGHRVRQGRAELFNSAFLVDRGGRVLGRSDKQRLLPFAERMPLGEQLPFLYDLASGAGQFSPGAGPQALPLDHARLAALVCYEDILPGFVRDIVRATRPHLLVNITNDAWFGDSAAPHIHLALSVLRAVEHRRALVRATNSGVSAIVDPVGRVVARGGTFRAETLVASVPLLAEDTLYTSVGDWPGLLCAVAIALMCLGPNARPRVGGRAPTSRAATTAAGAA
jgi:apolipoprotein N-acyltransferase